MPRLTSASGAAAFIGMVSFTMAAAAHDGDHHGAAEQFTGPASAYAFALPEPGTYRLPPIRAAAGGQALTEDGTIVDHVKADRDAAPAADQAAADEN